MLQYVLLYEHVSPDDLIKGLKIYVFSTHLLGFFEHLDRLMIRLNYLPCCDYSEIKQFSHTIRIPNADLHTLLFRKASCCCLQIYKLPVADFLLC